MPAELTSPVPPDCPLQVKNLKIARSLSEETLAYTATLYWKGKRVADASNHGTGGPDMYHFDSREVQEEVEAYAREHVEFSTEAIDQLVGEIIHAADLGKDVRKLAKQGYEFVALCFRGHYDYPSHDGTTRVTGYSMQELVAVQDRTGLDEFMGREKVEAYRILYEPAAVAS